MQDDRPRFGERAEFGESDVCYRHPDRHTFTLCQRCGNNICPDCQNTSAVGVLCPDCVSKQSAKVTKMRRSGSLNRTGRALANTGTPVVTYTIMGLSLLVFIAQNLSADVTVALWYAPLYSLPEQFEPWRMITAIFTHSTSSFFHILFNLYALWLFGRELERYCGRAYFTLVYFYAGLGGSLAVMLWGYTGIDAMRTPTVGASGAIFGVLGAVFIVMRATGGRVTSLFVLIAINVGIGFLPGTNISWQAHLGGLIVGTVTMLVLMKFRGPRNKQRRIIALVGLGAVLVALSCAYFVLHPLVVLA